MRHQKIVDVQGDDENGARGGASDVELDVEVTHEDEDLGVGITRDGTVANEPVIEFRAPLVARWNPAIKGPIPSHDHVTRRPGRRLAVGSRDLKTRRLLRQDDDVVDV